MLHRVDTFDHRAAVTHERVDLRVDAVEEPRLAFEQIPGRRGEQSLVRAGHRMSRDERSARDRAQRTHHAARRGDRSAGFEIAQDLDRDVGRCREEDDLLAADRFHALVCRARAQRLVARDVGIEIADVPAALSEGDAGGAADQAKTDDQRLARHRIITATSG